LKYEDIIRLATSKGYYIPSGEIYPSAAAGFWEYGPHGTSLKRKFIDLWRQLILKQDDIIEIDGSQIMNRDVFVASGHLESFSDPITTCTHCNINTRADRLIQKKIKKNISERMLPEEYDLMISNNKIVCPDCKGKLSSVRQFNMMFKVGIGPSFDEAYLRPETCQNIFINFPKLFKTMRGKLPMGIAQVGKSFRNEIAPRQSLLRMREFNQAEIEIFFNPNKLDASKKFQQFSSTKIRLAEKDDTVEMTFQESLDKEKLPNNFVAYYMGLLQNFYEVIGIDPKKSRFRLLDDDDKAFYAETAFDYEVKTDLGWIELVACNNRTDYDLQKHASLSGTDFTVIDNEEKITPHVFELSMGVDRSIYCILDHSFTKDEERQVLRLNSHISPIQVAIFPLVNRDGIDEKSLEITNDLKEKFDVFYDQSGSIGRRYRRMDEIGTPYCLTIDYQTLEDETITIRERDTMNQSRIHISKIKAHLSDLFSLKNSLKNNN